MCANDPVNGVDPLGLSALGDAVDVGFGAAIGLCWGVNSLVRCPLEWVDSACRWGFQGLRSRNPDEYRHGATQLALKGELLGRSPNAATMSDVEDLAAFVGTSLTVEAAAAAVAAACPVRVIEGPGRSASTRAIDETAEVGRAERTATWVDEAGDLRGTARPGMRPDAYNHQAGAPGARCNLLTGRGQAPYLQFVDEAGNIVGAKFDGLRGTELIDRKLNPFFSTKAVDQARRQIAVAQHYGLQAVWELPTPEAVSAANRFMQSNKITGITVRLGR